MTGPRGVPRRRGLWGPAKPMARDLLAGASVALVLIPQALAYAEVAGLPSVHGLYAAAVPLIAAAAFASCPYLQTGPVALTALLTYGALMPLADAGSATYVGAAALLALIVGATRAGDWPHAERLGLLPHVPAGVDGLHFGSGHSHHIHPGPGRHGSIGSGTRTGGGRPRSAGRSRVLAPAGHCDDRHHDAHLAGRTQAPSPAARRSPGCGGRRRVLPQHGIYGPGVGRGRGQASPAIHGDPLGHGSRAAPARGGHRPRRLCRVGRHRPGLRESRTSPLEPGPGVPLSGRGEPGCRDLLRIPGRRLVLQKLLEPPFRGRDALVGRFHGCCGCSFCCPSCRSWPPCQRQCSPVS